MVRLEQNLDELDKDEILEDYFVLASKEQGPISRFVSDTLEKLKGQYQKVSDEFYRLTGW